MSGMPHYHSLACTPLFDGIQQVLNKVRKNRIPTGCSPEKFPEAGAHMLKIECTPCFMPVRNAGYT
jgi:hypothetical protein